MSIGFTLTLNTDNIYFSKDSGNAQMTSNNSSDFRVFLCYAEDDKPIVRKLYDKLTNGYIDAWFDEEKLLPGQDWKLEIPNAIRSSDVVMILLSNHSITKEGFVQKEIKYAIDIADEKPEGTIFIIPVRLEDCKVPSSLTKWQWLDYFGNDGYEKLIKSFEKRANNIGKKLRALKQEIIFTCEIYNKPINLYENEGQIYISRRELFEAQRISEELSKRDGLISASEFEFAFAHWHIIHYECVIDDIDSFYEIATFRIRSLRKLIGWTSHLMEKRWIDNTDWFELLREVIGNPDNLLSSRD